MTTVKSRRRKAKMSPAAPKLTASRPNATVAEAAASAEIPMDPIDIITNRLGRARATADLLISITMDTDSGAVERLDEATLNWSAVDIRDRLDEARAAALELQSRYWALQRAQEKAANGGAS